MLTTSLIHSDNTMALMAITLGWVAFTIYAEQKWQWASKVSGVMIALAGAMLFSNLGIIPTSAVWFDDIVWGYVVPLAIPLLLLQCNIKKIWIESGRLLIIYLIGAIGTAISAVVAFVLLESYIPSAAGVGAMMTGSYIGGSVNLATMMGIYEINSEIVSATIVADNLLMACYFFVLIGIPSVRFVREHYAHPYIDGIKKSGTRVESVIGAAVYWDKKPISLIDIAMNCALSAIIVASSRGIGNIMTEIIPNSNLMLEFLVGILGNQYIWMTTISMLIATFASKQVEQLGGTQEIGTFFIYIFFFTIGVPASITMILQKSPLLLLFCFIMIVINMAVTFIGGKILDFTLEEIILASNANIGGPTTAAAMAISQGWTKLVGPIMLIGTLGYVIGTYAGMFIGQLLGA